MKDPFVIPECIYRVSSFQKSNGIWIPAQNHCGNDSKRALHKAEKWFASSESNVFRRLAIKAKRLNDVVIINDRL